MNTITSEIEKLMRQVKEFKVAGIDPKARNKVTARLEEAWLWSQHLVKLDSPTFPVESSLSAKCICPAGVKVSDCPVHSPV